MTVRLAGVLTVPKTAAPLVREALIEHTCLSRAEPGCSSFDVTERSGSEEGVFDVAEAFADQAALQAHQARIIGSAWAAVTKDATRDYEVTS